MRTWGIALLACCCLLGPIAVHAENMSVGIGPTGQFFLIDGNPQLGPGLGGHIFFDYRWAPQVSTQFTFHVTTENGKNGNAGDNDILFFTIPAITFKYYFIRDGGRFDPYGSLGVGLYMTSEGSRSDGTLAFGFGANAGLGFDCYLTPQLSAKLESTFHSIGMINALRGNNNGAGLFPITAAGSIAFHF